MFYIDVSRTILPFILGKNGIYSDGTLKNLYCSKSLKGGDNEQQMSNNTITLVDGSPKRQEQTQTGNWIT